VSGRFNLLTGRTTCLRAQSDKTQVESLFADTCFPRR
jgi:hypothetical protein